MKFIKIAHHTEDFKKIPPAKLNELLEAHTYWMEEQKNAGKLLGAYVLAGNAEGERNITIWDFESPEEIDKCIWEDPMGFTFVWAIYPAVDVFEHIKHVMTKLSKD